MEVVINRCFGGFSLSAKATKRYWELKGKECYFFVHKGSDFETLYPVTLDEVSKKSTFWCCYSSKDRADGTYLDNRNMERNDPDLVKVVKELGEEADGECAELSIVEIPDGVSFEIEEYDGMEHIAETHRIWR